MISGLALPGSTVLDDLCWELMCGKAMQTVGFSVMNLVFFPSFDFPESDIKDKLNASKEEILRDFLHFSLSPFHLVTLFSISSGLNMLVFLLTVVIVSSGNQGTDFIGLL